MKNVVFKINNKNSIVQIFRCLSKKEKLELMERRYDIDGDGMVTEKEHKQILTSIDEDGDGSVVTLSFIFSHFD